MTLAIYFPTTILIYKDSVDLVSWSLRFNPAVAIKYFGLIFPEKHEKTPVFNQIHCDRLIFPNYEPTIFSSELLTGNRYTSLPV